jgi:hypothetical protein
MVLGMLRQRPRLHDRLLLPALDRYASELKDRQEGWKQQLAVAA